MKKQRAELDRQIAAEEAKQAEKAKQADLDKNYVKICCDVCAGYGDVSQDSGSDNMDVLTVSCEGCGGRGYLYARKWTGIIVHDITHQQAVSAA